MRPTRHRSDEALLQTVGPDAGSAFAEFYARYERPMLAFFTRRVRNADVAADLTAETFARAIEMRPRFAARRGSADGWLFGIANNVLRTSARSGRVRAAASERLAIQARTLDDTTRAAIEAMLADDAVTGALAELPPSQRDAVRAHILDGDSYSEIAENLDTSTAVVRKRVSRALASLRSTLGNER